MCPRTRERLPGAPPRRRCDHHVQEGAAGVAVRVFHAEAAGVAVSQERPEVPPLDLDVVALGSRPDVDLLRRSRSRGGLAHRPFPLLCLELEPREIDQPAHGRNRVYIDGSDLESLLVGQTLGLLEADHADLGPVEREQANVARGDELPHGPSIPLGPSWVKSRPSTSPRCRTSGPRTSAIVTGRPKQLDTEAMTCASRPHGLIASNRPRSVATFRANPCSVTQRLFTATPIDANFRCGSAAVHSPVHPSRRPPAIPSSPTARISASSSPRRYACRSRSPSRSWKIRVPHQLPRPVIGDVAAALDLEDRHAAELEQVLAVGAAAQGHHVGVLDQHERVGDLPLLALGHELALQLPDLAEVAQAEVEDAGWYQGGHRVSGEVYGTCHGDQPARPARDPRHARPAPAAALAAKGAGLPAAHAPPRRRRAEATRTASILETSPYLLQHAHNPVNWYAWGDEAFAEARRLGRPVFLSVGYSTCHWCHVMEGESFEDEEIAALPERALRLHQGRPRGAARRRRHLHGGRAGADRVGRLAHERVAHARARALLRRHLLPAARRRRGARARLPRRCCASSPSTYREGSASASSARRAALDRRGPRASMAGGAAHAPARSAERRRSSPQAVDTSSARFDARARRPARARPSSPRTSRCACCCATTAAPATPRRCDMATLTLEKMAAGGMYDQLGGGFHRYSTDDALAGAALREDALRQRAPGGGLRRGLCRSPAAPTSRACCARRWTTCCAR